jgi:hypothetical protein
VKIREDVELQCFASLGQEHYREGMFELVKRWDKSLNAKRNKY